MTFSTSTFILQLTQTMHTTRVGQYDGMFHYSISELLSLIIHLTEFPSKTCPALPLNGSLFWLVWLKETEWLEY